MNDLPNEVYFHVFQRDPQGIQVFEDMCRYHYDISVFDENPYVMAHNEGRREVIRWLMMKCAAAKIENNNED